MKPSHILVGILLTVHLILTGQNDIFQSQKLKKIWEIQELSIPECVLPVPGQEILYVSNLGGANPSERVHEGFISILGTDGRIIELRWITDLNSPKGMALFGDYLFVTEIDQVSKIDTRSGEKVKSYPVGGAEFLNDIAVDDAGVLYITDSRTGSIHKLHNDSVSVLIKSDEFPFPNGIIAVNGKILVGTGEKVISIAPQTLEVNECLLTTGSVDGLAMIGPGEFLFSDWAGRIYFMRKGGEKELLLDTTVSETFKTADFGYIPETKRIVVPTFFRNSVICYELNF